MHRLISIILLSLIPAAYAPAQEGRVWHNKACAVCLTYDDALNVHLDNVIPALDSAGLKATFYLSGFFPAFKARASDWKTVAVKGNELGNHTLFHPCTGNVPGREWVRYDYDMNNYTMQRLYDEIEMANILLGVIDGKKVRTFAYPCGDTKIGDSSYVDIIKKEFIAARGVESKIDKMEEIDLYSIGSYMIAGQSGDDLIGLVKNAMEKNALVVFLFHGVGGEHNLDVSLVAHDQLLRFLKQNEKDIWVAPLIEIAQYIREYRTGKK